MIREAEMKDYLDIARLSGVLGYPISEAAVKKNLARILKDADHEFLVFELGERVTAFIEAEIYAPVYAEQVMLNVLGLVVDEKNQGQGIGAQLLNALEEAKAREIKVIRLNSGVKRHEAHQFYEHQGYTSNHSQKRFLKFL